MKKILFVATVPGHIMAFHLPYLDLFQRQGFEVHVATSGTLDTPYCDVFHHIPIQRSPFHPDNVKAYRQLKKIIADHSYDLIHCHTPTGGFLTRIAAHFAKGRNTRVFYTAHGFHFFKGAPKKNWLLFYPAEKLLARYTDCLITINEEDYVRAKANHFKAKQIVKVDGVGVNLETFQQISPSEKQSLRNAMGYQKDDFILFYAAEINSNKNQKLFIPLVKQLLDAGLKVKVLLAGSGSLLQEMDHMIQEENLQDHIILLGLQTDILPFLSLSDVLFATSRREGLPINIVEGMACGKPIVATDIRGHRDLVQHGENGFLFALDDVSAAGEFVLSLARHPQLYQSCSSRSLQLASKYSVESLLPVYQKLYLESLADIPQETAQKI